ncbi:MAG: PIN domain-containing protein [Candidatus Bathyarchaeia archaeon]
MRVRLLLDTTYLMPLIKIKVREVSEEAIRRALREHEIIISEAQIFELYAKGAKYLLDGLISIEDLVEGVEAAYYNLERIPITDRRVMESAARIRRVLPDLLDSIILSTALHHCEGIATIDRRIVEAFKEEDIRSINPDLKLMQL